MLVTQQGEVIVQIEQNAEATAQDLKHGNRNLSRAIDIARSTRAVSIKQPLGIAIHTKSTTCVNRKNGAALLSVSSLLLSLLSWFGGLPLIIL